MNRPEEKKDDYLLDSRLRMDTQEFNNNPISPPDATYLSPDKRSGQGPANRNRMNTMQNTGGSRDHLLTYPSDTRLLSEHDIKRNM
jgi:hypothetical protein